MNATELLNKMPLAVKPEAIDGMDCTVQLNISRPSYVRINDGVCSVHEGVAEEPDVSLTMSDDNLIALMTGKLSGVMAFMTGKLKVEGDLMLAKEIPNSFDTAKLV